ncbi:MAG: FKBP-type peptidyl-prolyl cis-trans isomerase [Betaproteobacteria bacterium]|nr:FKBP-type peptidyl-prolyl cis-trans isomerase [Betaproteobacteria bacterium]
MKRWLALLIPAAFLACSGAALAEAPNKPNQTLTMDGMTMIDSKIGNGRAAHSGDMVVVHYSGWLYDPTEPGNKGAKFDSSVDRGQPFSFRLGMGQVIRGWDEGVAGMKVGGQRTLVIPPELGYGSRGAGNVIPPNATLLFDVELLEIR